MKTHLALAVIAALLISATATATAASQVYWRDYKRSAAVEPGRVDVNHGASGYTYATRLKPWRHWGGERTLGEGRIWRNTCRPSCAAGNYEPHRGKVRLSHIHRCGDRRFYGRIKFIFRSDRLTSFWVKLDCQGFGVDFG